MSFIYLTQSRKHTYWPIVFLIGFVIVSGNMFDIGIFQNSGKAELDNELLKLYLKKATMFLFSLITLTGVSFT